jgi:hypothetical protein
VSTGQEAFRTHDGEAHEVLDQVTDTFGRFTLGYPVDAVMSAGVQGAVAGIDAQPVDMAHPVDCGSGAAIIRCSEQEGGDQEDGQHRADKQQPAPPLPGGRAQWGR